MEPLDTNLYRLDLFDEHKEAKIVYDRSNSVLDFVKLAKV